MALDFVLTMLTAAVAVLASYLAYLGFRTFRRFRDKRMAFLSLALVIIALGPVSGWYMCEFSALSVLQVQTVESMFLLGGFSMLVFSIHQTSSAAPTQRVVGYAKEE